MISPEEFMNQLAAETMAQEGVSDEEFNSDLANVQDHLEVWIENGVESLREGINPFGLFAAYIAMFTRFRDEDVRAMLASDLVIKAQNAMMMEDLEDLSEEG